MVYEASVSGFKLGNKRRHASPVKPLDRNFHSLLGSYQTVILRILLSPMLYTTSP